MSSRNQLYKFAPEEYQPNLNLSLACPDCKSSRLVEHERDGDMVCGDCGRVLADRMPTLEAEWRTFQGDAGVQADPSRVGGGADQVTGLTEFTTLIGQGDKQLTGPLRRAAKLANQAEEVTQTGFVGIQDKCSAANLSNRVVEAAKKIYNQVQKKKILKGKPTDRIEAACIFLACKQQDASRSLKEVSAFTRVPPKYIAQCYTIISRAVSGSVPAKVQAARSRPSAGAHHPPEASTHSTEPIQVPIPSSSGSGSQPCDMPDNNDRIARGCNYLGLPVQFERFVKLIMERQDRLGILGSRAPTTMIAASLYMVLHAVGRPTTLSEVGKVMDTSAATIKGAYKLLYKHRDVLLEGLNSKDGNGSVVLESNLFPKPRALKRKK
ncbi:hypothetical protein CROQUDRAFT_712836 [Cronartium quercuum f. sp. fusiforme G11]|uniref:General transcription factor TFIIB n=1 Tax=Cronartium quercuum f. sp. fusiforme G11 TaxID=708437 RepID=A0A9P6NXH1_9BASI|nr:hypothetical protein CROQUDRAFT_712836 [Cronartium quercuum f. sp. fusiforme G11]